MSQLTKRITEMLMEDTQENFIRDEEQKQWLSKWQANLAIQQLIRVYKRKKIVAGDKILVSLENCGAYPIIMLSAYLYGLVVYPIAPSLTVDELRDKLMATSFSLFFPSINHESWLTKQAKWHSEPLKEFPLQELTIFKNSVVKRLETDLDENNIKENSAALVMFTSGTTGKPKKVVLTHHILLCATDNVIRTQKLNSQDITLIVLPLFHINAQIIALLSTILSGGKIVIPLGFSASHFWTQIKDNCITWVSASPSVISILLVNKKAISSYEGTFKLRFIRSASAPLSKNVQQKFSENYNLSIIQGYGMTEAAGQICVNPLGKEKIGSVGKVNGTEIRVLDNNTNKTKNKIGEVLIKGENVITHYPGHDMHEDFIDGWLKTGDLGYFDDEGYLFLMGRLKEQINYGGHKINPLKIENIIQQAEFVKEVVAVGVPDKIFGEKIVAVVVLLQQRDMQQAREKIIKITESKLAEFERPKRIVFTDRFPRNKVGKILRLDVRRSLIDKEKM